MLLLLAMTATAGSGCGEECRDLTVRECNTRNDCAATRMRVKNRNGSHDTVKCVERSR